MESKNSGAAKRAEVYIIIGGSLESRTTPLIALLRGCVLEKFSSSLRIGSGWQLTCWRTSVEYCRAMCCKGA